jgi:hypothetical protein
MLYVEYKKMLGRHFRKGQETTKQKFLGLFGPNDFIVYNRAGRGHVCRTGRRKQ